MPEPRVNIGVQDTGNPVLDSLVNLMIAGAAELNQMESVHQKLLKVSEQQPGGLKARSEHGHLLFVRPDQADSD